MPYRDHLSELVEQVPAGEVWSCFVLHDDWCPCEPCVCDPDFVTRPYPVDPEGREMFLLADPDQAFLEVKFKTTER